MSFIFFNYKNNPKNNLIVLYNKNTKSQHSDRFSKQFDNYCWFHTELSTINFLRKENVINTPKILSLEENSLIINYEKLNENLLFTLRTFNNLSSNSTNNLIHFLLNDLHKFHSKTDEIKTVIGEYDFYPYEEKLKESLNRLYINLNIKIDDLSLEYEFIKAVCYPLKENSKVCFRDAGLYNLVLSKQMETVELEDITQYIYHIDFETSKWMVCKEDDLGLILESTVFRNLNFNIQELINEYGCNPRIYYLVGIFRSLRNLSRRLEYLSNNPSEYFERYNSYGSAIEEQPLNYLNLVLKFSNKVKDPHWAISKYCIFLNNYILPILKKSWSI